MKNPVFIYSASAGFKPEFFPLLNTKQDIVKNVSNQSVDGSHSLQQYFFHTMEVNGYQQLFGFQHSSKYHLL